MAIGQREGRRRRVIREDSVSASRGTTSKSRSSATKTKPYADDALVESQPRITDLIPDRVWGLLGVLLFGVATVAGVQGIYYYRATSLADLNYQIVSGMNLYGPGTITSWLSSVYLLMAAAAALLVYNTRRHKIDDYRGKYSLWVWMSVFCVLASLDASTGLHRLVQYALTQLVGTPLWGDGSIWWILVWGSVGCVVGGRALIDMWPCRGGVFFLSTAAVCYATASGIFLGVYQPNLGWYVATVHSSLLTMAHFLVLFSFLLYARSIHRMAQGAVGARKRGVKKQDRWWSRQRSRFAEARQRRTAERLARKEAKAAQAEARRAMREADRQKASSDDRDTSAEPAVTKLSKNQPQIVPRKGRKREAPIKVTRLEHPEPSTPNQESNEDVWTVEELELELLTNPNLTKAERKKLRKQLKQQQRQQTRAA